jgi:hypothetical protein
MATSEMAAPVRTQARSKTRGGSPIALLGIGFSVLFFVAFMLNNSPDSNASNATWTRWFANSGHRTEQIESAFLFVIAALCLLSFLTHVWTRVNGPGEGLRNPLPLLAATFGAVAIAIGGTAAAVVAGAMAFGSAPEPSPDVLRYADNVGYPIITVAGMIAVALAIGMLSVQAGRSGLFGRRLMIFGVAMAVITLASFEFFPLLAVLVWCIVVGIVLARREDPAVVHAG